MSDIKQVIHFHKEYEAKASNILEIVSDFYIKGENVFLGERNTIKNFKLKDEKINIKSFKKPNIFNAFVYKFIRKSKAKRSFEYAQKLIDYGISTPFPIAYIEHIRGIF